MHKYNTSNRLLSFSSTGHILILLICVLVYSDSFHASWHLDDYPNILSNLKIHISDLSPDSIEHVVGLLQPSSKTFNNAWFRPVAFLSFALNWYAGNDQLFGYHLVNVGIHILCASALFVLLQSLFRTPNGSGCCRGDEKNIALLAAILWAIHPIQTQAVTYIVQRMTLLATLFYIAGMLCYIQARLQTGRTVKLGLYSLCVLSMILAVGSKENTVIFPLSLALAELIFFQDLSISAHRKTCIYIIVGATIATGALSVLVAFSTRHDAFVYISHISSVRPFTPMERLLTESRVVIGYLSQIFFPLLSRFSIEHSVTVSTSLLKPVTTLASITAISGLLVFALLQMRNRPFISFSILFYFLNHLIESTLVPLELIFEHRNYLPSAFVFLPVAIVGLNGLRHYQQMDRKPMFFCCFALVTILLIVLGITTYLRNEVWFSEKTLWEDTMPKAPLSSRPYTGLALYYDQNKQDSMALGLYEASLSKQWTNPPMAALTLSNMAKIYVAHQDYEKALELYDRSIAADPVYFDPLNEKAQLLTFLGKWDQAQETMASLMAREDPIWNDLNLMGFILLRKNQPEDALRYLRQADRLSSFNPKIYMNIGMALSMEGYYEKADWFLIQAARMMGDDIEPLFCLMDNHFRSGDMNRLRTDMIYLFNQFSIGFVQESLLQFSVNKLREPVSVENLKPLIMENLNSRASTLFDNIPDRHLP